MRFGQVACYFVGFNRVDMLYFFNEQQNVVGMLIVAYMCLYTYYWTNLSYFVFLVGNEHNETNLGA